MSVYLNKKRIGLVPSKIALLGAMSVGAMAFAPVVSAQVMLEEIIVTAQKRSQNLQDVGVSVTAFSGRQLAALGITSSQDITNMTPGVHTVQPNGEANYSLAIRGAANSDLVANQESPVSVYIDEVYISQGSGTGFMLFDMDRVEVLRGPQGTLFGRNATGGLAHFITKRPTEEFEGYGQFTIGQFGQLKTEGAVSGALADGVYGRVSVSTHQNSGFIENRLSDENLNNANNFAVRAQLLLTPGDSTTLLFNVRGAKQDIRTGFFENVYSEVDPNSPQGFGLLLSGQGADAFGYADPDNNTDVYAGDYDRGGHNKLETLGLSVTFEHDFDNGMSLTSITDYQETKRDYVEDTDAGPNDQFNFWLNTDAAQISQEIRLSGNTDSLNWVTGIYYLGIDIDDANGAEVKFYNDAFGIPFGDNGEIFGIASPYQQDKNSFSVFAQVEYEVTDTMTLIGGVRYIRDKVEHSYVSNYVFYPAAIAARNEATRTNNNTVYPFQVADFLLFPDGTPVAGYDATYNKGLWAGRVQLNYTPEDSDSLFYVSYNRGVKGGGFNSPFDVAETLNATQRSQLDSTIMDFDEEIVNAFEIGAKLTLAEGLRINTSVYYNDYENYQAFNINGLDTRISNSEAKSRGFELELQASPGSGFDLILGIAYNDTDVDVPSISNFAGTAIIAAGYSTTPVQSPKWNLNGLVRKAFDVSGGQLSIQGDFVYRSEHYFNLNGAQGAEASSEDGYAIVNGRIGYTPDDADWELSFFVNNVFGKEYLVQTFDLAAFGFTEQYYGRPRWWGASVRFEFGG